MEPNNLKELAISNLKSFRPSTNNDVINIIETIRNCYVEPDVANENGIKNVHEPTNQSCEVSFLIEELQSFIDEIKKN